MGRWFKVGFGTRVGSVFPQRSDGDLSRLDAEAASRRPASLDTEEEEEK